MREAVIVAAARTPIGKAYRGAYNKTAAPTLASYSIKEAINRAEIDPKEVEDVVMGCAQQQGTQAINIGRLSGIAAGFFATLSYSIVVWSMQYIEIAYVSSIREVSIIFATIIGMLFLFEKNAFKRIMPAILIVIGITLVYFQIL